MKLKAPLLILLFSLQISIFAQNHSVQQFLKTSGLEQASIGFCIKDLSGKTIVSHNAKRSYTPASTLKIITTASALEILSPTYTYQTKLGIDKDKNRLVIIGSGDPTLGTEHLKNNSKQFISDWTDAIITKLEKTKNTTLNIFVKDDKFGYQGVSRKWIYEDIGNYYGAASYGISIFDNTYRISFNTINANEAPQITDISPRIEGLKFTNTLTLNTTGKDNGYIIGSPFTYERTIIGNIPLGRQKFTIKGATPDPGMLLGKTISELLMKRGYKIDKVETSRNADNSNSLIDVFYTHQSPKLSEIIRDINVRSNNHYSEHLIRTLGVYNNTNPNPLALEEGIERVKEFWTSKGLDAKSLFMYDGSGLAPSNAVSAEWMCDILLYMQAKSKWAQAFLNSLPVAGQEGTVKNFLKGTRLEGKVFVKSGSIANVQCFAGYYIDEDKKYTFSIMVNNFNGTNRQVIKAIERLLLNTLK